MENKFLWLLPRPDYFLQLKFEENDKAFAGKFSNQDKI
jgi:hypothetical protein